MRRPAAAVVSLAWFAVIGGTFGCLLPYLLNYWHFHEPLPYWWIARVVGALLICGGLRRWLTCRRPSSGPASMSARMSASHLRARMRPAHFSERR